MIKTHIIVDFYQADSSKLGRKEALDAAMSQALESLNLEIKARSFIQFEPEGVTATIVGELFHFSIHTWPEHGSCAIDLYSAKDRNFGREIADALKISFQAKEYDLKFLDRSSNKANI